MNRVLAFLLTQKVELMLLKAECKNSRNPKMSPLTKKTSQAHRPS